MKFVFILMDSHWSARVCVCVCFLIVWNCRIRKQTGNCEIYFSLYILNIYPFLIEANTINAFNILMYIIVFIVYF